MNRIKIIGILISGLCASTSALAQDLEAIALEILTGRTLSASNCFMDGNGDGIRDGVKGSNFSIEYVRAITNRADVLALAAELDAAATAPRIEPNGIETPVVVIQSATNEWGIGVVADDDGNLATYIDHQSPRPSPEVIRQRIADAIASNRADRATAQDAGVKAAGAGSAAAAANSVPDLREQVRILAEQVQRLAELQD